MTQQTCTLVIGPQRTGTSMVSGILHHLGVDMCLTENETDIGLPNYESTEFAVLCNRVCKELHFPRTHEITHEERMEIREYAASKFRNTDHWGVKIPQLSVIGHHVIPLIPHVRVIFTYRDFESSVKSMFDLYQREFPGYNLDEGTCRYIQGQQRAGTILARRRASKGSFYYPDEVNTGTWHFAQRVIHQTHLDYDNMISMSKMDLVEHLAEFALGVIPRDRMKAAMDFIDPRLKRF